MCGGVSTPNTVAFPPYLEYVLFLFLSYRGSGNVVYRLVCSVPPSQEGWREGGLVSALDLGQDNVASSPLLSCRLGYLATAPLPPLNGVITLFVLFFIIV